jgi:DNA-binding MarR family transcriptional regulator
MSYHTLISFFVANDRSSAQIALCNHQVSTLQKFHSHLDDYGARIARLSNELQTCIAKVTEMIKDLSDKGLVHHLPISA